MIITKKKKSGLPEQPVEALAPQPVLAPAPEPEAESGSWRFMLGGVYRKAMAPHTLFGVMYKARKTGNGVISGYISCFGLPDDVVREDGSATNQWEYVTGGYNIDADS
jgi:hypothetical protein